MKTPANASSRNEAQLHEMLVGSLDANGHARDFARGHIMLPEPFPISNFGLIPYNRSGISRKRGFRLYGVWQRET